MNSCLDEKALLSNLVGPEATVYDHLLQVIEGFTPRFGQLGVVGLLTVIDGQEHLWVLRETLPCKMRVRVRG